MTEHTDQNGRRGSVLYDAACPSCRRLARFFHAPLASRGFSFLPLQTASLQERPELARLDLNDEMRVITRTGDLYGGARAIIFLAGFIWWAAPLRWLARSPRAMQLLDWCYRQVASRRHCAGSSCRLPSFSPALKWLPLLLFPASAGAATAHQPRWLLMWALAFAIFAGCKWLSWCEAAGGAFSAGVGRSFGYFLFWPGMDAAAFLDPTPQAWKSSVAAWVWAGMRIAVGALIIWVLVRYLLTPFPLVAGWAGMAGVCLLLHFGIFDVAAFVWQSRGVRAAPIMRRPTAARSVGEFWSVRWNRAFNDLVRRQIAEPLRRSGRRAAAVWVPFLASGVVHELVISVPAGGGYGLPTLYFLLQAAGIVVERSALARALQLRGRLRGRIFAWTVIVGPVGALFHPPFIRLVMFPFFKVLGAT